ncbi:MAG: GlsB/YeaQ/YmgE family stress response membrane protein [Bacteroidota bacterium]|nr:GlsB/YeaQ/YmgE family stress response membrane protein [Bacteroidota bacterium]
MSFLYFILIGALAGWLAGLVWKGTGFGLIGNILIGIVGGLIGGWAAGQLHLFGGGFIYQVLVAAGGALILLFLLRLIRG